MPLRPLLLGLALLLSGCAALSGSCCNAWRIEGDDPGVYDAFGAVDSARSHFPRGLTVTHARLDEAWGSYTLSQVFHLVDANGPTTIQLQPTEAGDSEVLAAASADMTVERLRAAYGAFLEKVLDARGPERDALLEALLANRTNAGERTVEPATDPPTYEVSYHHYAARTSLPHRAQAAFDAATSAAATWDPEQAYAGSTGQVEAGGLVFSFAFPTRMLEIAERDAELTLQVDAHGPLRGHLRVPDALDASDARARIVALLAARGATVDASAWTLEGSDGGAWRAPGGSEPTPTPS